MLFFICLLTLMSTLAAGSDPVLTPGRRDVLRLLKWRVQDFVIKIPSLVSSFSSGTDPLSSDETNSFAGLCANPSLELRMLLVRYGGCPQMLEAEGPGFVRAVICGLQDIYLCEPLLEHVPRPAEPPSSIQASMERWLPDGYTSLYLRRAKRILALLVRQRPDLVSYIRFHTAESLDDFTQMVDVFKSAMFYGKFGTDSNTRTVLAEL